MAKEHPFGAGIGLDDSFDLTTDTTGDLAVFTGHEEVEKDLSLLIAFHVNSITGMRFSKQDRAKIRVRARSILQKDERVAEVTYVAVRESEEDSDVAVVETEIMTITGEIIDFNTEV